LRAVGRLKHSRNRTIAADARFLGVMIPSAARMDAQGARPARFSPPPFALEFPPFSAYLTAKRRAQG
jgi:hypothetical protein